MLTGAISHEDMRKVASDREDVDEEPHHSWRDSWEAPHETPRLGARARIAVKHPMAFMANEILNKTMSKQAVLEILRDAKLAGEWEQGSGGSAAHVMSLRQSNNSRLGGAPLMRNMAAMMRPTMDGGMYGGFGTGPDLAAAYQSFGAGNGW